MPYCSVVAREAIDYYGDDVRSHPVGTGPFVFVKWLEGNMLILHRNEHYFEFDENGHRLPFLDAVNFRFINNKSTEFLKFMNGELDFVSDIDVSLKDQILTRDGRLQSEYADEFNLLKGPYLNVEYLSILMDSNAAVLKENPLKYRAVRQAMNYAFSRSEMLLFLRNNRGIPAYAGIVPPSLYVFQPEHDPGYNYNPAKAAELLVAAGFPDGIGLPQLILHTTPEYQDYATYIKDKLEDIGIAIQIETKDPRLLREMRVNKETAFFRSSWIADYSDPESFLQIFYGKNGAPPNYTHYKNNEYDKLYESAVAESDLTQRELIYQRMDSLMMADAPVIPLYYDEVYRFVRKNVVGLEPDALNMLQLKRVRFTD
jgi:oligopeptide transport system substrate-binding protein